MNTLNDNVDNAKKKAASERASFCNLPREYFLAADRGEVYIIKGIKIW